METIGKIFTLQRRDLIKGAITAAITVVLTSVYNAINEGTIPTDWAFWKPQLVMGLSAGIAYVLKNFLTNSNDEFLKKE